MKSIYKSLIVSVASVLALATALTACSKSGDSPAAAPNQCGAGYVFSQTHNQCLTQGNCPAGQAMAPNQAQYGNQYGNQNPYGNQNQYGNQYSQCVNITGYNNGYNNGMNNCQGSCQPGYTSTMQGCLPQSGCGQCQGRNPYSGQCVQGNMQNQPMQNQPMQNQPMMNQPFQQYPNQQYPQQYPQQVWQ